MISPAGALERKYFHTVWYSRPQLKYLYGLFGVLPNQVKFEEQNMDLDSTEEHKIVDFTDKMYFGCIVEEY